MRLSIIEQASVLSITALSFVGIGVLLIAFLFLNRIIKSYYLKRHRTLHDRFLPSLNSAIIMKSHTRMPNSSYQFYLTELKDILRKSRMAKQGMINQLVAFRKNLTGVIAKRIEFLFVDLELPRYCLKKLKSHSWRTRALATRELAMMHYTPAFDLLQKNLNHPNPVLREETLMALIELDSKSQLSFLTNYTGTLSPWMKVNIHRHLTRISYNNLPEFSQWFTSDNVEVVLFSLSMVRQFRQSTAIPSLKDLLFHTDQRIVGQTIECVGELEDCELADKIIKLTNVFWNQPKMSERIARSLGKIGHTASHRNILMKYLSHDDYETRFEATLALSKMGYEGQELLYNFNIANKKTLTGILNHLNEPLLN